MPYSSPVPANEGEFGDGPPVASGSWSTVTAAVTTPAEVSPKDTSTPTFRGPEVDQLPQRPSRLVLDSIGSHQNPKSPVTLSATSSSSSFNPIHSWSPLNPDDQPPRRDPFDATMSFSEDPFGHRSSESSSGDDFDLGTRATAQPAPPPPFQAFQPRDLPSSQQSFDSLHSSLYSDPGTLLHQPQPRPSGPLDPYFSASQQLTDSLQTAIQTLRYVVPPHLFEDANEQQYAGCSIQMPATSISALLTTLRGLNYLSANLVPICGGQAGGARVVREFELGQLVQNVADELGAELVQAEVELGLLRGDVGLRSLHLLGDRDGIGYLLSHVIRQILAVANKGDTIEVAFQAISHSPRRMSEMSLTDSPSASPAPLSPGTDILCTFEILHNVNQTLDLNVATPRAELLNPFTNLLETRAPMAAKLDTPLCSRLLRQMNAWIKSDVAASSPGVSSIRNAYELSLVLPTGRKGRTTFTEDDGPRPPLGGGAAPLPSMGDLTEFIETLRNRKVTLFASDANPLSRQLVNYLTNLGLEVLRIDAPTSEAPVPSRLVIVDDDLPVLRRELARLKPDSLSLRRPLKRPGLFRASKTVPHMRQSLPATTIIYLTSIDKYQQVKDALLGLCMGGHPETLVIPKPVGPQRLIASLYVAIRQPVVHPAFSPIATSPRSPQISSGNRTPTGGPQEGFFDSVDLQVEATPQRARSPLGEFPPSMVRDSPRLPISTPGLDTPASEYFSRASKSTSGASGVVLKSPDGRPLGVYFEPPGSGRSASFNQLPTRKSSSQRTPSDNGLVTSPSDSVQSSRRASAISNSTEESAPQDERDLPPPPSIGRRKTLPTPPDATPIFAHGRERSTTVTRHADDRRDKQLPDASKNRLARPPMKADVVVPPINVLIVEDNPINQNILSMFFRKKKIRHQTAKDGLEAVEKWRTGGFHLILMDIQLPVMDGIEATKEIRKLEKSNNIGVFPSTPLGDNQRPIEAPASSPFRSSVIIVALTASSLQTDRVAALAAGCNDFLTKPVSLKWLEKKTVEWGCMQALIDFEGWRRWKGSDTVDPSETKRGFQTGPEAAALKVANRLRIDRHKWRPAKKNEDKDKPLPTLPSQQL